MHENKKKNENFFNEKLIPKVTDGLISGIINTVDEFINNYEKRRNVGYGFFDSIGGSFDETLDYCLDGFFGIDHKSTEQAIYFIDNNKK